MTLIKVRCGCVVNKSLTMIDDDMIIAYCKEHSFLNLGRHPYFVKPIVNGEK